ncbi:hypothetical protein HK105_205476 [Polyrhizophydium stewartii]|uniref:Uncharacterized protein n=1 Tax=Polyrhizophydium stewartii TaxID=2732419 RepID=A0ABR4N5W8_9FUNG
MLPPATHRQTLDALVARVTGFQPGTDNHAYSVRLATDRLRSQTFMAADAKRIAQRCRGLAEKYLIRGDDLKAETLSDAIAVLETTSRHPFDSPQVTFDTLALLLELSESATAHVYERALPRAAEAAEAAEISWKRICEEEPLQGDLWAEPDRRAHAADSELEPWSDDSDLSDSDSDSTSDSADKTQLNSLAPRLEVSFDIRSSTIANQSSILVADSMDFLIANGEA